MTGFLRSLLGQRSFDLSDPAVGFGLERAIPAWAWALIVAAALIFAIWSYTRLIGPRWARTTLGLLRAAIIIFVVLLILGPQLVKHREFSERDWVVVLVDRSASLTVADAERVGGAPLAASPGPGRITREAQLRSALESSWPMWRDVSKDKTVLWLGFDAGAFDLAEKSATAPGVLGIELGEPSGQRTAIGSALDQALARVAARPVSGVVVLSDGRSLDEPTRAAIRRLQGERIPVHCVALGSAVPVGDLLVRRTDAPRLAFVNDPVPVRVDVERIGGSGITRGTVRLIDKATGRTIEEKPFTIDATAQPGAAAREAAASVTLRQAVTTPGVQQWSVEVVPETPGADLVRSNNTADVAVETIDRPMRVLFIDGYPRWEERYLKNLLVREKSISCSTLILAPDKKFTQEGDVEIDTLPDSPERWAEYDAIILGDVRPDVFTKDQLLQIRDHIAKRGAGLVWIAGAASLPMAWWGTPLADLLPFTKDAVDGSTIGVPSLIKPTPGAERLGILRLGDEGTDAWPAALSNFDAGWSQLRWVQRIEPQYLKPTAEALAIAVTEAAPAPTAPGALAAQPFPVLLQMKYGAGRIVYCATDEIWRWRYARGETLYERFWTPILRLLGRDALSRSGRPALLVISPEQAAVEQPVKVSLELLDQSLADMGLSSIVVRLTRQEAPSGDAGGGGKHGGESSIDVSLRPEGSQSRIYSTIWTPPEAGTWVAEVADGALAGRVPRGAVAASIRVSLPDDELRRPEADHELLARLSSETGGQMLTAENLSGLPAYLPNRAVRSVVDQAEPLSDTPLALILVVGLLTLEWVGRRVIRLI